MNFTDMTSKENLVTILPLKGNTRGEDIYYEFIKFVEKLPLPVYKLVCIATDSVPAMMGRLNSFCIVSLCYTYAELCAKMLNLIGIMHITLKIVSSIRSRSLQRRLFKVQLEKNESEYCDLLLNTELLPEVIQFLNSRGEKYDQLSNEKWLHDLAFFNRFSNHPYICNLELQGKKQNYY